MTDTQKIATTKVLVGNDPAATNETVDVYLSIALQKILGRLYPYDSTKTAIPEAHHMTQCELAARLFLRRGAEGEKSHNENGINRTYDSVDDEDILSRLTPFIKVV